VKKAYFTPPAVAEQLGVKSAKILIFIASGELSAINVATKIDGRPRWRVPKSALDAFLAARSNRPAPAAPPRRRRRQVSPIEFF